MATFLVVWWAQSSWFIKNLATSSYDSIDLLMFCESEFEVCAMCFPFGLDWGWDANLPRSCIVQTVVSLVIWFLISLFSSNTCVSTDSNFWLVLPYTSINAFSVSSKGFLLGLAWYFLLSILVQTCFTKFK